MIKKKNIVIFAFLFLLSSISFANEFKIQPASGTKIKYYCDQQLEVWIKKGDYSFSTFASILKFNTSEISLLHNSVNPFFNTMPTGYMLGSLYFSEGGNIINAGNSDIWTSKFTIKTRPGAKPTSTELLFVNRDGLPPDFDSINTDDGITITSPNFVGDTLIGVHNATYYFEAYPCINDINPPIIYPGTFTTEIDGGQIIGQKNIEFLILDWTNTNGHYWYQGSSTGDINNYTISPSNVDNQNGVNPQTINVLIDHSASHGVFETPDLTILDYTGGLTPNRRTWNSLNRGYWVSFENAVSFEVEKPVTITITGYDYPNYLGQTNLMTRVFKFNSAEDPTITLVSPENNSEGQNYISPTIIFQANDSWAGIDIESIKISIPEIWSGDELLMTGRTYSGSDLDFELIHGQAGLGNSGGYLISLNPKRDFPSNTTIQITGIALDLAGNSTTASWTFFTMYSCEDLGCHDFLNINFLNGIFQASNPWIFSGTHLVATGLSYNSNYPYLTGINNDVLVCGYQYSGTALTGNIDIYGADGTTLINGFFYTGDELYITGLNFIYNGHGTITVLD